MIPTRRMEWADWLADCLTGWSDGRRSGLPTYPHAGRSSHSNTASTEQAHFLEVISGFSRNLRLAGTFHGPGPARVLVWKRFSRLRPLQSKTIRIAPKKCYCFRVHSPYKTRRNFESGRKQKKMILLSFNPCLTIDTQNT